MASVHHSLIGRRTTVRRSDRSSPEAERSAARVADIELGLRRDTDARYWRERAVARILALDDDAENYGLFPYEEAELLALRALIGQ